MRFRYQWMACGANATSGVLGIVDTVAAIDATATDAGAEDVTDRVHECRLIGADEPAVRDDLHQLDRPIAMACGGNHRVVIDPYARVWICGELHTAWLDAPHSTRSPRLLPFFVGLRARLVACGWAHTAVLLDDGRLVTWGSNASHQLAHPSTHTAHPPHHPPAFVAELPPVHHVACGWKHTVASTRDGHLFAWGNNRHGQCGVDNNNSSSSSSVNECVTPHRVAIRIDPSHSSNLERPTLWRIACGWRFTCAWEEGSSSGGGGDNHIWTWGCNARAQCGLSPTVSKRVRTPHCISLLAAHASVSSSIVNVAVGWTHALVLLRDGSVYGWGRADLGQLPSRDRLCWTDGDANLPPHIEAPTAMVLSASSLSSSSSSIIVDIACGSEHSVFVTTTNVWTCGWNEHGNLGHSFASSSTKTNDEMPSARPAPFGSFVSTPRMVPHLPPLAHITATNDDVGATPPPRILAFAGGATTFIGVPTFAK